MDLIAKDIFFDFSCAAWSRSWCRHFRGVCRGDVVGRALDMWVVFAVGSHLYSEGFFSGFSVFLPPLTPPPPLNTKTNAPSDWFWFEYKALSFYLGNASQITNYIYIYTLARTEESTSKNRLRQLPTETKKLSWDTGIRSLMSYSFGKMYYHYHRYRLLELWINKYNRKKGTAD